MMKRTFAGGVRKRIFDNGNDEDNDNDEGSEIESSWMIEEKKKDNEIAEWKRKNKSLEIALKEMRSMSRVPIQDKTGWTGGEINFVKDINDSCRDRLYIYGFITNYYNSNTRTNILLLGGCQNSLKI